MKRAGLILFAFFYLIMSSGFAVNVHYCGGEFESVSMMKANDNSCCGMDMTDMDCCKTHSVIHEASDNTSPASVKLPPVSDFNLFCSEVPSFSINFNSPSLTQGSSYVYHEPVLYESDTYLKCRVLLI